jgi:hypothetical protein
MNSARLIRLGGRRLTCLCLAVIVVFIVAACSSNGSDTQSGGGSNAQPSSAIGSGTGPNTQSGGSGGSSGGGSNAQPSSAIGTDTASNKLALASGGGGGGGGQTGLSVPVRASAVGNATSVPFTVSTSTVSVGYAYDCSSTGGSGFTADLISGSASNPGSDDEEFANESDVSNSATTTVNLQDTPGDYYIQVSSPCAWTVVVESD